MLPIEQFRWPRIARRFVECLGDDSGAALAEYWVVTLVTLPACYWLYHPDNGFYKAARDQYELTTLLLLFPGP